MKTKKTFQPHRRRRLRTGGFRSAWRPRRAPRHQAPPRQRRKRLSNKVSGK